MISILRLLVAVLMLGLPSLSAAQDYRIGVGDQLSIQVLEDESLNRTLVVLPSGTINFPYAGAIRAEGATPGQVQSRIASGISRVMTSPPTVFVSVTPAATVPEEPEPDPTIDVFLMGEIGGPGPKTVPPGTTFLQALSQAGGLTRFAATKRIQLRRKGDKYTPPGLIIINYNALMNGAAMTQDVPLVDGDVIIVPERKLFE